ncbi:hypothetical protein D3C77_688930 [compost metagenome]
MLVYSEEGMSGDVLFNSPYPESVRKWYRMGNNFVGAINEDGTPIPTTGLLPSSFSLSTATGNRTDCRLIAFG